MVPKRFVMTDEQLATLLDACKPTPAMYYSDGRPMFASPEENANRAWKQLGKELGFDWTTVEPSPGEGNLVFFAIPTQSEVTP